MFSWILFAGPARRIGTVLVGAVLGLLIAALGAGAPGSSRLSVMQAARAAAPGQTLAAPGSVLAPTPDAPGAVTRTERTRSQLLSSRASIAPGERFWVGLRQDFDAGWHSYWRNPGDSGFPATLAWTLPSGATAGPTLWPAPDRQPFGAVGGNPHLSNERCDHFLHQHAQRRSVFHYQHPGGGQLADESVWHSGILVEWIFYSAAKVARHAALRQKKLELVYFHQSQTWPKTEKSARFCRPPVAYKMRSPPNTSPAFFSLRACKSAPTSSRTT